MKSIEEIKADYHLFIDVQMEKYLRQLNKTEFSNAEEVNFVMSRIAEAYNQKIASDHLRLDNLNKAAKTDWFNSIEVDFNKGPQKSAVDFDEIYSKMNEFADIFVKELERINLHFNDIFPFLPEETLTALIFIGPALAAYGMPSERFREFILGSDEPTEIEEDAILWAFDISFALMGSLLEDTQAERNKYRKEALEIAGEELDTTTARFVVEEMRSDMIKIFGEEPPPKKKKKKK